MRVYFPATAALLLSAAPLASADASTYLQNAGSAANYLVSLLNQNNGLWYSNSKPLWWNSANMLTGLIDLMAIDATQKSQHQAVIATIYANAPNHNPHATRKRSLDGTYFKEYHSRRDVDVTRRSRLLHARSGTGFLNGYYDDEGWWAMALLDAYDLTRNIDYLNSAIDIWNDMKGGQTTPCGTSIWWDRKKSYIATIANELYFSVSATIANRVGTNTKQPYVDAATSSWNWLSTSGVMGSDHLIRDGVNKTNQCQVVGAVWTYNQGVILGGLVEFATATGSSSYLDTAATLATASSTSSKLVNADGILHEPNNCDTSNSCGVDGNQFKGVYVRNLRKLYRARPTPAWKSFLEKNAQSIWRNDLDRDALSQNGQTVIGVNWAGPYAKKADGSDVSTAHSSGMEAVIAAAAVQ